ncbi:hypothetical protein Pmani_025561 [Petrolisthes manimaculis]|uniref:Uncharacterized protein n=1 Tax=Petrolisthes manimaculis TaxID=1843537 RepID=A0AAE1U120_9EUCA|nr:hypothetical protein Pmani_025561 [Petrolisthes manimaculis]
MPLLAIAIKIHWNLVAEENQLLSWELEIFSFQAQAEEGVGGIADVLSRDRFALYQGRSGYPHHCCNDGSDVLVGRERDAVGWKKDPTRPERS